MDSITRLLIYHNDEELSFMVIPFKHLYIFT